MCVVAGLVALLALLAAGCAGTQAADVATEGSIGEEAAVEEPLTTGPTTPEAPVSGLLYVAGAKAGQIEGDWPTVTVTLTGVDTEVLWFQDRPGRSSGEMRVSEFVGQWNGLGFADDPPNAVIRHDGGDGLGKVVEVSDPAWDQPNGSLTFTATAADHREGTEPLPWLMSDVSMFVDDGGADYHPVKISLTGMTSQDSAEVELVPLANETSVFSVGPASSGTGLQVDHTSGPLPLHSLSVTRQVVAVQTMPGTSAGAVPVEVDLYLQTSPGASRVVLKALLPDNAEATVTVGGGTPQKVGASRTNVSLDG